MRIQEPSPKLSKNDLEIILLIAEIVIQGSGNGNAEGNISEKFSVVTEEKGRELLRLLENLLENKEFREKVFFVEGVGFGHGSDEKWKRLFFRGAGRRAVHSTQKWEAFNDRIRHNSSHHTYARATRRMDFEHFMKMEEILFDKIGIDPRVKDLFLETVSLMREDVEKHREQSIGTVRIIADAIIPLMKILEDENLMSGGVAISSARLSGLATLVSNCSVLFSTRDWGIAGTISTMAGSLAMLAKD